MSLKSDQLELSGSVYGSVDELCANFKDLENGDQLNYLLNSGGPIEKAVAIFFYLQI